MKARVEGAFELSVGLEAGLPALLHPGRGDGWWWTAAGPAWQDGERLWVKRGDRVLVVPMGGPADVEPVDDGLVAWTPGGGVVHLGATGAPSTVHGPEDPGVRVRNGADVRAVRRDATGWRAQAGRHDLPLPEGAVRASDLRPWRRGEGVVWRDDGWVFRMARGRSPRAIVEAGDRPAFAVGPQGALLVGDLDTYLRGAPANGSVRPLPVPLIDAGWGLRWSAGGRLVAGVDADGGAVTIDLVEARVVSRTRDALPLDTDGRALRSDGGFVGCDLEWTPREAPCAIRGDLLGGPGGAVWDLAEGRRCFPRSTLAGVTVPTEGAWATVDWESGDGRWIDPRTGKTVGKFAIAVRGGDLVTEGWADGEAVVLETAEGRQWVVRGADASSPAEALEAPEVHVARAVEVDDRLFARGAVGPLPFDAAAKRGPRVWAWNADGLLVALAP